MYGRLLIISDPNTVRRMSNYLQSEFSTVDRVELGADCLSVVLRLRPEFIILDAREDSQSFTDLCRCIRSIEGVASSPLVALVRRDAAEEVDLLEAGADDCWAEPFEERNVRVRLSALNRRLNPPRTPRLLRRGGVEVDLDRYTVSAGGRAAQLTVNQMKVLRHLMENAGCVISHGDLLREVWGESAANQGALRTRIKRLRQVLSATGAVDVIRSVKGGYLFDTETAPVRVPWDDRDLRRAESVSAKGISRN